MNILIFNLIFFLNFNIEIMKIHLIAIGGSAMHNMAIALHKKGFEVSGSDDEIFEPSKTRLDKCGILPENGWDVNNITKDIDAIILGMHARIDNPELLKAQELGLKIYSYPEYIYEQSKDKIRVVIGGSHGKTTITSMIMHVLKQNNIDFDYMVGAQIEGFDTMVKLTKQAKYIIIEGDEYLSSPIDMRPKFHLYKPHIALLSGIAWDHINVFPTFENYVSQFEIFVNMIEKDGSLIYFDGDKEIVNIVNKSKTETEFIAYNSHNHKNIDGITYLQNDGNDYELVIFGDHNMQNISGAKHICNKLGVSNANFYKSMMDFGGAAKRLQLLGKNNFTDIFLDFAHSPSKLKATTQAVSEQYKNRELIACMELHTFSSLKEDFLPQYKNTMKYAEQAFVYFNPHTLEHKKLKAITKEQVKQAFASDNVTVFDDSDLLQSTLKSIDWKGKNLLLMSSGNFSGIDFKEFTEELLGITS